MANSIYPLWKQALMKELDVNKSLDQGPIDQSNGVFVSMVTVTGGYQYSDSHQYFTSITNIQGPSGQAIGNTTVNGRVFDGDDVVLVNVISTPTNAPIEGLVLWRKNTGPNTSWRLVLYEDTGILGFPVSTNGGNIVVTWNSQGIFGL